MNKEKEQIINELHKPARRNFKRRRVIVKGIDDLWQADLADMQSYSRQNKGHRFILIVIDVFSKFCWCEPLKSKSGKDVTQGFSNILTTSKRKPKNLQVDSGTEFYNTNFQALMKENKINLYSTFSTLKASVAERLIRTLKNKLWKKFSLNGSYEYLSILQDIVKEYNHTKHRTIKMKPFNVNKKNAKKLLNTVYNRLKISPKGKFKLNDYVRISKYKTLFRKSYLPNWSSEIFKIRKV